MLKAAVPQIHVSTSAAARSFYADKLGFTQRNAWRPDETKDDPCYMAFERDGVWLQITSYEGTPGTCVYVYVDDVDALHAEFVAKDLPNLDPVRDQPWKMREFAVTDPDSNTLRFGQQI